jgi:hypothetical protein
MGCAGEARQTHLTGGRPWRIQFYGFRVVAYAALMRDEHPPFRLDTGGTDPGVAPEIDYRM